MRQRAPVDRLRRQQAGDARGEGGSPLISPAYDRGADEASMRAYWRELYTRAEARE